ncbi:MAG: hypothetical protein WBO73_06620 [Gammaproteobacteria bacterium]|jgi:hypothetical protein
MNTGRGNSCSLLRVIYLGLWLGGLFLPVDAMAQQPPTPVPGYNPWAIANPYYQVQNPAPPVGPATDNRIQSGPQAYGVVPPWAYPVMPAPPPGYQAQYPASAQVSRPYVEIELDSTEAYVHQNLVMSIKVISTGNLKTVAAQLPDNEGVIIRQLGDITVGTRTRRGQREIVNTLYYQLTPIRSGRFELDSVRVTGTIDTASPYQADYDAITSRPVVLMVSDPEPGVLPWLPLHELELNARLSNDERIGEGEPLTLTVEQRAVGMSGTQLPSIEAQLQAPGHRLYREKSEYEGTISKDGKLVGTRRDRFTLVPQQGNRVDIPAIRVGWWNVDRQRKETAVLPGRLLNQRDLPPGQESDSASRVLSEVTESLAMWLFLLALTFLLGRFWTRLMPGLRHFRRWLWSHIVTLCQPLYRRMLPVLVRLSPQRNLPLIRRRVADTLPRSARLWFCVRGADEEQDADDWSQVLRFLVNRRLGLSAQLPMSELAEQIIQIHPGADANKIRLLLNELEAALFSGRPIQDFDSWKKAFKHQLRPRLYVPLRRKQRINRDRVLPSLNPG